MLVWHRTCYFTAEDGRYVKTFHAAVNRSFDGGGGLWMAQSITDKMLNSYLMTMIFNTFTEDKQSLVAAACIGRQPGSKVWILNNTLQINHNGIVIDPNQQSYIWISDKIASLRGLHVDNSEQLAFLANSEIQHRVQLPLSNEPFRSALGLLRNMMGCNFMPAVITLAAVPMNIHFEYFQSKFDISPVVVLVGHPQSGKTTSLRVAAALTGSPGDQFSEVTDAYAAKRLSESTMGLIIDDSSSSKSVSNMTIRQFNNLARGTLTHGKQQSRCGITYAVNYEYLPSTRRYANSQVHYFVYK